jgi:hypothetical protein
MTEDITHLQLSCVHFFFFMQANQILQMPSMFRICEFVGNFHLCWVGEAA